MSEFTEDRAFRVLLVIGLFSSIFNFNPEVT